MTNYFMIYRPFHFEYAKKIIETHFSNDTNILINHYNTVYKNDTNNSLTSVHNISGKLISRIQEIKNIKKQILTLANTNQEVNVFIPHTLGILSNYSFFKLSPKYKNIKINVFYEGIIFFYNYNHNYITNLGYYTSRWIASRLSGIVYTINGQLLDLNDNRINKIYTPFLTIDAPKEKLVEIPLQKIEFNPLDDTCVILGLRLANEYKEDTTVIIAAIYKMIIELNIKQIYFKDHPSEKNDMFNIIAAETKIPLKLIHDTAPIETIIDKYRPKHIISMWSSGLINLKCVLPASTLIYCFVTKKMVVKEQKKIIEAFEKQDILIKYA